MTRGIEDKLPSTRHYPDDRTPALMIWELLLLGALAGGIGILVLNAVLSHLRWVP